MKKETYFTDLLRRKDELETELKKIKTAIETGRAVCNHDYQHIGNTHKAVYECKICKNRITA